MYRWMDRGDGTPERGGFKWRQALPGIAAAALFGAACTDVGSVGMAPEKPSSVHAVSADRPRPVDLSDVPPGAKADTARVQQRYAPLLAEARVTSDGQIVRNGAVLGVLRSRLRASTDAAHEASPAHRHLHDVNEEVREVDASPGLPMATAADGDEGCWYLIIYYLDNGEIISVTRLGCTNGGGGSGPQCTADQEVIAAEYEAAGEGDWSCTTFDDAVTQGSGTHGHQNGYLSSSYTSGSSAVWSYMSSNHGVTGWINSDWRCPPGNTAVGGSAGSLHMQGRAGDFDAAGFDEQMALWFRDAGIAAGAIEKLEYTGHYHLAW